MAFHQPIFNRSAVYLALSSALTIPSYVSAEQSEQVHEIERIQVTGSRRVSTVQETPINITALDSDVMDDFNITELADVARWVPGLSISDQGGREGSPIIVRGLNTNSSGPDNDGGTVATYIGEIPLTVDMKIIDVERVEVLIGPQGTLYGAGTLGGAIRYLPNKPVLDETSGSIYGDISSVSKSDDTGGEAGFIFNTPIIDDTLALRVAFNYLDAPGYIDYNYVVREPGVSLPDPDWADANAVNANLKQVKDANTEEVTTARFMLRWQPNDKIDTTLAYHYQKQDIGARSIVHYDSLSPGNPLNNILDKYESGYRYVEPKEDETSLLSLEVVADLGFAELTSATGVSNFESEGQRDQTDLLIRLDYSYEEFPAFSSFTREIEEEDSITQEIRLTSTADSPLSWIVGLYYNDYEYFDESREFTPGFSQFAVDNLGAAQLRPDALEYLAPTRTETKEKAIFGELNYQITEQLDITLGARFYKYKSTYAADNDFPLLNTHYNGAGPNDIDVELVDETVEDDGNLFKFNISYQFTPDVLTYATISEGFRLGGSNGIALCPANINEIMQQIPCTLPDEFAYEPDTTTNYELGFKSTWYDNKLHFNAALFYVEWDNAQVASTTENAQLPILINAANAKTNGIEISTRASISQDLTAFATYAYTKAELTEDAASLGALDGDRLPGAPEQQFSLGVNYNTELPKDILLDLNYGLTYQSDVYSTVGLTDKGEKLPSYALSNASAVFTKDEWAVTLYVDNMFDKYTFNSVRQNTGIIDGSTNGTDIQRNYGHYILKPRTIGIKVNYSFDL